MVADRWPECDLVELTLITGAVQQVVDQGRHVTDVNTTVMVIVGSSQLDSAGIVTQHIVDQGRHVADVNTAVTIHVTCQHILNDAPEVGAPV